MRGFYILVLPLSITTQIEAQGVTMNKTKELVLGIRCRFEEDKVSVYGAHASFFIMVSMGPFLIAAASLIQFFLPGTEMETITTVLDVLPEEISEIFIIDLINEIFTSSAPSIVSVSVILALWSSSKGIMGMERCLHAIYRVEIKSNYLVTRLRACFYTIVLLITIVFALGLLVFGHTLQNLLTTWIPPLKQLSSLLLLLRSLLSAGIFILAFTAIYQVLSGARRRFIEVLPGVLFATVGWFIFSLLYAFYITNFSRYTVLYGSLGALALFMLWLYFCILILLIGAEFNVFLENHRSFFQRNDRAE